MVLRPGGVLMSTPNPGLVPSEMTFARGSLDAASCHARLGQTERLVTVGEPLEDGLAGTVAVAAAATLLDALEDPPAEFEAMAPVAPVDGTKVVVPPVVQTPVVALQTSGVVAAREPGTVTATEPVPVDEALVVALPPVAVSLAEVEGGLARKFNVHPPSDVKWTEGAEKSRHQPPAMAEVFSLV